MANMEWNPLSAKITEVKPGKESLVVNLLAGILLLVSTLIAAAVLPGNLYTNLVAGATSGVVLLLTLLVGGLFVGWVFSLIANRLGGKGDLWAGYSPLSHAAFIFSAGTLIANVLALISLAGGAAVIVGTVLAGLVSFVFGMLSLATLWRLTKEHFKLDWTQTLIFMVIVVTPLLALASVTLVTTLTATAVPGLGSLVPTVGLGA